MNSKKYYVNQLTTTLALAFVSFFIVFSLINETSNNLFEAIAVGLTFSGIPSGWAITGHLFGDWIITGSIGLIVLLIRFMISVVIGAFALPIRVIYLIYMICTAPSDTDE